MKKTFCFLFSIVLIIISCDTREDFYKELNQAPEILVSSSEDNFWSDDHIFKKEITDTIKQKYASYKIRLKLSDEAQPYNLYFNSGLYMFLTYSNTGVMVENEFVVENEYIDLELHWLGDGDMGTIEIGMRDQYGKEDNVTVKLFTFNNLLPVADLKIINTGLLSLYEIQVDASLSYDTDKKYGGGIVQYEYKIDDQYLVVTGNNYLNYIFASPGIYKVELRVQDNDSVWSGIKQVLYEL